VSSVQWASISNNFVYSAMAVYALAVLVLAAERAFGARSRPPAERRGERAVEVSGAVAGSALVGASAVVSALSAAHRGCIGLGWPVHRSQFG
jgi:hypothetical protein